MAETYIGKARGTTVRLSRGATTLVYAGQPVPDGADPDDVQRLVAEGYLVAADATAAAAPAPAGMAAGDDPSDFNASEVLAYLETASDDERERVLIAEEAGKQRKSVLAFEAPTA